MKRSFGILLLILCALCAQANSLVNGDFEAGNVNFTSAYTWGSALGDQATYTIDTSMEIWAPGFRDHTSGSGNMMIINGAVDTSKMFWSQTVDVVSGVEYTFTGFAADLTYAPTPQIQLLVNGADKGQFSVVDTPSAVWQEFSFIWTASATESVNLELYDLAGASNGDDFAIDDLSMVPEPASAALIGLASILLIATRRTIHHYSTV